MPVNYSSSFQIEVKATIGDGVRGDIAIDNILVQPGRCPTKKKVIWYCDLEGGGYRGS